ncbi:MAG: formylmethanofuran dehydrogenase subunit E [Bryobacteraceae bacterium]|nr:MAG: formylmethanofuran dehydrogenase subunit E [Bryobacteraceae bacterium]
MLKSLAEYEELARQAHGHLCAGQILGIRMALHGLALLGLDDPKGVHRKRLVTFVEIDRCATDAIGVVTGCRLGKRALKFLDYGKMAATFCDLETGKAVRVSALESSKERAAELFPHLEKPSLQQMEAYRVLPPEELFSVQWVDVRILPQDLPGFKGPRVFCSACGERINFGREVLRDGRTLCRPCAGDRYYDPLPHH